MVAQIERYSVKLARQTCVNKLCGREFRPPDRRKYVRCERCREARWRTERKPATAAQTAEPVEVPTWTTLDSDGNRHKPLCERALRLARQASTSTELPVVERDEYTRCLVAFAEDASTGHLPPEWWQRRQLGHLLVRSGGTAAPLIGTAA